MNLSLKEMKKICVARERALRESMGSLEQETPETIHKIYKTGTIEYRGNIIEIRS